MFGLCLIFIRPKCVIDDSTVFNQIEYNIHQERKKNTLENNKIQETKIL